MKKTTEKTGETVTIGRAGSPAGIKGEVRITLYAQDSDNLKEGKVLLLERGGILKTRIERIRYQKGRPVVKLEGIDDRNAAEEIRNAEVSIYADDLEELPEGEHYVRDLIGFSVVDIASGQGKGRVVGTLRDVIQNTAQSVLEVETCKGGTVLIPAVDAFLRNIDAAAGVIEVELIPGFLD